MRIIMSFIDITDPKRRDRIVADYLATVKRIQQRNLDDRAQDLARDEDMEKLFKPIVKSNEQSTSVLRKELLPMRAELEDLNDKFKAVTDTTHSNKFEEFIKTYDRIQLDDYYGIEKVNDGYMMGDKKIQIDESSNIYVDDVKYNGTDGLWSLIMLKKPDEKMYNFQDLTSYKDLIEQTNVKSHPRNVTRSSRPKTTYKWRKILSSIPVKGDGVVHFLPGDIKGMKSRLNLLLAEYAAGNRVATRNEIVPILDELLRRRNISRAEYTDINNHLGGGLFEDGLVKTALRKLNPKFPKFLSSVEWMS